MNEDELRAFRTRFGIPDLGRRRRQDAVLPAGRRQPRNQVHARAAQARSAATCPTRKVRSEALKPRFRTSSSRSSTKGTEGRKASTTMVFVRLLSKLLRDKELGRLIVPIVPDEARTFGMEALFRQVGIYSHVGQTYEPVDMDTLLYYKEASDGQILEEGITEAGSMSSFIAAGTAYATHGVNTIPFFIYYSMFGFQRIGDLIWAAGDARTRGFLLGGTAGPHDARRRRAAASGRQQPAVRAGLSQLRRLRPGVRLRDRGDHRGRHPADVRRSGEHLLLPDGDERAVRDAGHARGRRATGILKGLYRFRARVEARRAAARAVVRQRRDPARGDQGAGNPRSREYNVGADVWSVTSYSELYREGHACGALEHAASGRAARACRTSRSSLRTRPACSSPRPTTSRRCPIRSIAGCRGRLVALGTDGFGRSESRASLREFFEVDYRYVIVATLAALARDGKVDAGASCSRR